MSHWFFNPDYRGAEAERHFADLAAVFAVEGEVVAEDPQSRVLRVALGDKAYYVKRYVEGGRNLRRRWLGLRDLFGAQRVRKEWENLRAFAGWGIPSATLVAYGLERRCGRFFRGALITEEITGTVDMAKMARNGDPRLRDTQWLADVSHQLAGYIRTMHAARFVHNDLKWRNLLVDGSEHPTVYLIDCPSGAYWWQPFLEYRKIKDLACLDKLAKYHLSRTRRLRFYLDYVQHERLTVKDRRRLGKVLAFFEGRE